LSSGSSRAHCFCNATEHKLQANGGGSISRFCVFSLCGSTILTSLDRKLETMQGIVDGNAGLETSDTNHTHIKDVAIDFGMRG
jgi:hypothetical protein